MNLKGGEMFYLYHRIGNDFWLILVGNMSQIFVKLVEKFGFNNAMQTIEIFDWCEPTNFQYQENRMIILMSEEML